MKGVLFFDGACGMCTRSRDLLVKLNRTGAVQTEPLQQPGTADRLGIPQDRLMQSIWWLDSAGRCTAVPKPRTRLCRRHSAPGPAAGLPGSRDAVAAGAPSIDGSPTIATAFPAPRLLRVASRRLLTRCPRDEPVIRPARTHDLDAIGEIYAHHVLTGVATFETVPPDRREWERRLLAVVDAGLPFVCAETRRRSGRLRVLRAVEVQTRVRQNGRGLVYVAMTPLATASADACSMRCWPAASGRAFGGHRRHRRRRRRGFPCAAPQPRLRRRG